MESEEAIEIIKRNLISRGISEEPAEKAAVVGEFLYRTTEGRAGRRVSQILLEGDFFNPGERRPFEFGRGLKGESTWADCDEAYSICDNVCIGLEVLLHLNLVYSDNQVRYSLSGRGLGELRNLIGAQKS